MEARVIGKDSRCCVKNRETGEYVASVCKSGKSIHAEYTSDPKLAMTMNPDAATKLAELLFGTNEQVFADLTEEEKAKSAKAGK